MSSVDFSRAKPEFLEPAAEVRESLAHAFRVSGHFRVRGSQIAREFPNATFVYVELPAMGPRKPEGQFCAPVCTCARVSLSAVPHLCSRVDQGDLAMAAFDNKTRCVVRCTPVVCVSAHDSLPGLGCRAFASSVGWYSLSRWGLTHNAYSVDGSESIDPSLRPADSLLLFSAHYGQQPNVLIVQMLLNFIEHLRCKPG